MMILKGNKNCVQNKCKKTTEIGCTYEESLCRIKVSNKDKIILLFLNSYNFYVHRTLKVKSRRPKCPLQELA